MNELVWISVLALELGVQALIMVALVSSFFPVPLGPFLTGILPFFQDMVRPEREMHLYALFLFVTLIIQCFLLWFYQNRSLPPAFKTWVILGGVGLGLQAVGVWLFQWR